MTSIFVGRREDNLNVKEKLNTTSSLRKMEEDINFWQIEEEVSDTPTTHPPTLTGMDYNTRNTQWIFTKIQKSRV
jgi:hypothetical protein